MPNRISRRLHSSILSAKSFCHISSQQRFESYPSASKCPRRYPSRLTHDICEHLWRVRRRQTANLNSLLLHFHQITIPATLFLLLNIHAGLLLYSANLQSPTLNEPGHLVAGIAMWEYGQFDIYRVNPPLTRLVAALPVWLAGYQMDW